MDADSWHGEADDEVLLRANCRKPSESSLFGFEPPKVRMELRAKGKCVSLRQ